MTWRKRTIMEMAREAGLCTWLKPPEYFVERIEAFAELVRADEAERYKWDIHSCGPTCTKIGCVAVREAVKAERENTNNAYKERNQLVALLSTLFPSGKAKTAIDGWDEAWHGCVYIDFPWGQASWHYHTDDEWMFEHLSPYTAEWDGHTTEAKYAMITSAIRKRGQA